MKTIELLPKNIIDIYRIQQENNHVIIFEPVYINIEIDDKFSITEHELAYWIRNNILYITLYKDIKFLHITIYNEDLIKNTLNNG